ncbi:MAG: TraR/DksA family transcriptional regulator, partial [Bdellovibrionales bacterium]|nr:TraR/DksA family transcriptional regulator [Bdellovibrionales bacterium]
MSSISKGLVEECKTKLLATKEELLNRVRDIRKNLHTEEKGGDEADQTVRVLNESEVLNQHDR